eukprot:scaffold2262_cov262-Pinguiococcus_pyrenoidosus.AAC.11
MYANCLTPDMRTQTDTSFGRRLVRYGTYAMLCVYPLSIATSLYRVVSAVIAFAWDLQPFCSSFVASASSRVLRGRRTGTPAGRGCC